MFNQSSVYDEATPHPETQSSATAADEVYEEIEPCDPSGHVYEQSLNKFRAALQQLSAECATKQPIVVEIPPSPLAQPQHIRRNWCTRRNSIILIVALGIVAAIVAVVLFFLLKKSSPNSMPGTAADLQKNGSSTTTARQTTAIVTQTLAPTTTSTTSSAILSTANTAVTTAQRTITSLPSTTTTTSAITTTALNTTTTALTTAGVPTTPAVTTLVTATATTAATTSTTASQAATTAFFNTTRLFNSTKPFTTVTTTNTTTGTSTTQFLSPTTTTSTTTTSTTTTFTSTVTTPPPTTTTTTTTPTTTTSTTTTHGIYNGLLDMNVGRGVPSDLAYAYLTCQFYSGSSVEQNVMNPGAQLNSTTVRFDLASVHGLVTSTPSIPAIFIDCFFHDGFIAENAAFGAIYLNVSSAYNYPGTSTPMWAASLVPYPQESPYAPVTVISQSLCAPNTTYCNYWAINLGG